MCPLKREQARCETQQWVIRRLPLQTLLWRYGEKVGHELRYDTEYSSVIES